MRVLVYKRTHEHDPDEFGRFGALDCMGRVRAFDYDAVIGIGGTGGRAKAWGIAGRLNWVGVGPDKDWAGLPRGWRGPIVTFLRYRYFGGDGPELESVAPALAARFYRGHAPRYLFDNFNADEAADVERLLGLVLCGSR